ncbi:viral protein 7 [Lake Chad virus]|uniref:Viral protein 7 n=1 Tax=Lake Chad virus TaxID=688438 RepID=A0A7T8EGZ3_9ORTO|nr:viral protein 7 [Lake Chad virus]QQO86218.1 viral protein 7 [Lake Chad virus]
MANAPRKPPILSVPGPSGGKLKCATVNYTQATHQLMSLTGDVLRILEKRDSAISVEARVKVVALRDAFYTDLLPATNCAEVKKILTNFGTAIMSVMVSRTNPVYGSALDPLQAILIRFAQVNAEIPGLPDCPVCT